MPTHGGIRATTCGCGGHIRAITQVNREHAVFWGRVLTPPFDQDVGRGRAPRRAQNVAKRTQEAGPWHPGASLCRQHTSQRVPHCQLRWPHGSHPGDWPHPHARCCSEQGAHYAAWAPPATVPTRDEVAGDKGSGGGQGEGRGAGGGAQPHQVVTGWLEGVGPAHIQGTGAKRLQHADVVETFGLQERTAPVSRHPAPGDARPPPPTRTAGGQPARA